MNINRKLAMFIIALIIFPMSLLMLATNYLLTEQEKYEGRKYLLSILEVAQNEMSERRNDMQRACRFFVEDDNIQDAIIANESATLNKKISFLINHYKNIDYAIMVDENNQLLSHRSPNINYAPTSKIAKLAQTAMEQKKPLRTLEIVPLDELYFKGSEDYNKFSIKLAENIAGREQYLRNALIELVIVPIQKNAAPHEIIGAFIVADIANSDYYFPEYIRSRATEGFLVLSVGGVRVATKATEGEPINGLIGTKSTAVNHQSKYKGKYFGQATINGINYIFLDEEIKNITGDLVGYISVGINEDRFSSIVTNTRIVAMFVIFICLVIMLGLGRILANHISAPVLAVTNLVRKSSEGLLGHKTKIITETEDESIILQECFNDFMENLKKAQADREIYLAKLTAEHNKQKLLAAKLKASNDNLEINVAERTQHLQTVVAELKKLDIAKSELLSNLSHELRTPLSIIINAADALSAGYLGTINDKQNKHLGTISHCANHLLQLINDLLDVSKMASGKMTLNKTNFSFNQLIAELVAQAQTLQKSKSLNIKTELIPEKINFWGDEQRIRQIIYNLLSNAIKFTNSGGTISLGVYCRGDKLEIVCKDTGIGIAPENQSRVFLEFEQVEGPLSKHYEGTGLGLPIVKKLVMLHDGEVFLHSELNKGTEIIITLPNKSI